MCEAIKRWWSRRSDAFQAAVMLVFFGMIAGLTSGGLIIGMLFVVVGP